VSESYLPLDEVADALGITNEHLDDLLLIGTLRVIRRGGMNIVRRSEVEARKEKRDRQRVALEAIAEINNEPEDGSGWDS
jgi:hypothetical protein